MHSHVHRAEQSQEKSQERSEEKPQEPPHACFLSIVIPCFNEQDSIEHCLGCIPVDEAIEIVVVDGGSQDQTCLKVEQIFSQRRAAGQSVILCQAEAGRARQMNSGVESSSGTLLLFLHADTLLPADFFHQIQTFHQQSSLVWGRFDVRLNNKYWMYRIIEWFINERSALFDVATGDQGLFMSRKTFKSLGCFANIPLMEDVALSKDLKKISSSYRVRERVQTSSRRWETHGIAKTIGLMWLLRFLYFIGVSPQRLHRLYYGA